MSEWVICGKRFTEGDVIEWTESLFNERWRGRGKKREKELVTVGQMRIVGQLKRESGEWVVLEVREFEILEDRSEGRKALRLPVVGEEIRRKRNTLERGNPRRLRWSDAGQSAESVRGRVVIERRKKIKIRKGRGLSSNFTRKAKPKPEKRR